MSYFSRWVKLAETLEDARRQAIALGPERNVNPNVDPSIENFGGTEAQDFDYLIEDIRAALDFDDDGPVKMKYRPGSLTRFRGYGVGGERRAPARDRVKHIRRLGRGL